MKRYFKKIMKLARFYVTAALVLVFCLFPLIWMLQNSFKNQVDALSLPPKIIFAPILDNYIQVFLKHDFWRYYLNSVIIVTLSLSLTLVIGVPCAYILARYHFKGKSALAVWILSVRVAPPIAFLVPFFIMFSKLHLIDTFHGLIIVYTAINLTLCVILMKSFFAEIPVGIEESAILDGCSPFQIFSKISLPVTITGITATASLLFILTWNELMFALVLTNDAAKTAPVGIYSFIGYSEIKWGELSAASTLVIIPVIFFLSFTKKYLIRGLTFGAVK